MNNDILLSILTIIYWIFTKVLKEKQKKKHEKTSIIKNDSTSSVTLEK